MKRTGPDPVTREQVYRRDLGRCVVCGDAGEQIHHRAARRMGGSSNPAINLPSNLLLVCQGSHGRIESHREDALDRGWLISQHNQTPASQIPCEWHHRTVLLHDDGSVEDVTPSW